MALYSNYAAWIAGVKDWLDADHLTDAQIGAFLGLAQARLDRELNAWEMEATEDVASFLNILSLPDDFSRIRQVSVAGVGTYDTSTKGEIANLAAKKDESRRLFAIDAGSIQLYPNVIDGTMVTIDYYVKVPEISASVPTNLFTTNYADVMLWASLVEGSIFIVEDERGAVFEAKFRTALEQSNQQPKKVKMGSTPLRRFVRSA
jgi:hypothetical protein